MRKLLILLLGIIGRRKKLDFDFLDGKIINFKLIRDWNIGFKIIRVVGGKFGGNF